MRKWLAAAKEQLAVQKRFAATVETAAAALNVRYCNGEFCDTMETSDPSTGCRHHAGAVSPCIRRCKFADSDEICGNCARCRHEFEQRWEDRLDCIRCSHRRVRVREVWSSMLALAKQSAGIADAELGCSELWDVIAARTTEALVAPLFAEDVACDADEDDDDTESRTAAPWSWPARDADALLERFPAGSELDRELGVVRTKFAKVSQLRSQLREAAAPHFGCCCRVIGTRRMSHGVAAPIRGFQIG